MKLEITVEFPYHFDDSVRDHGWIALAPCQWLPDRNILQRVERLSDGQVVLLHITGIPLGELSRIYIDVQGAGYLSPAERADLEAKVRWMLKLDEDLSEFYTLCSRDPGRWHKVLRGRGRLLRSPTIWEDVVKTILTTNITWTQTKSMNNRLVERLGDPYPDDPALHAFPTPEQVAAAGEAVFEQDIRLGYRNEYVLQLAREVVEGHRDLESLKTAALTLPPKQLKKTLKSIKGIGDYAAHTLMMILGHYGELAVDTELRAFVSRRYFDGKPVSDRDIAALYEKWDRWKYLAYWFDASS